MSTKKNREALLAEPPAKQEKPHLRTGCTLLDLCIGGGVGMGIPAGVMINIVGDKSSGKTFLANEIIAANHHRLNGGKKPAFVWHFDDSESGHTFDTSALYGVEIRPEDREIPDSRTVEEMDTNAGLFLRNLQPGQIGLYVVDSLDGLSDDEKEERAEARVEAAAKGKELNQGDTYGTAAAKFLSQEFFRTKTAQFREHDASLLIISQVRENLERMAFGKKYKRSGGKAMDFYAHTCLWLANICKIERGGRVVGVYIEAKTEKSKTPRPFRSVRFSLYFDYGIDDIGSSLDYLYDLRGDDGKLKKAAEAIAWDAKQPKTLETLRAWLGDVGELENARNAKKAETGKPNLSLEWVLEWVAKNAELSTKMDEAFGTTMPREALIDLIEHDKPLRAELERRVIEKWEAIEAAAASKRPSKYGAAT